MNNSAPITLPPQLAQRSVWLSLCTLSYLCSAIPLHSLGEHQEQFSNKAFVCSLACFSARSADECYGNSLTKEEIDADIAAAAARKVRVDSPRCQATFVSDVVSLGEQEAYHAAHTLPSSPPKHTGVPTTSDIEPAEFARMHDHERFFGGETCVRI